MKKSFLCIALALVLPMIAWAQKSTDEQEAQQVVINLFDALSNRDASRVRELCTPDVRFYEYGKIWSVDTLINLAITKNTAPDFKRTNTLDFVRTTIRNNVAWTTYKLHSSITRNGKQTEVIWMETVVLLRDKKRWRVQTLHSTKVNQ